MVSAPDLALAVSAAAGALAGILLQDATAIGGTGDDDDDDNDQYVSTVN